METKEELIKVVKEWVIMDNEIRNYQQKVNKMFRACCYNLKYQKRIEAFFTEA